MDGRTKYRQPEWRFFRYEAYTYKIVREIPKIALAAT